MMSFSSILGPPMYGQCFTAIVLISVFGKFMELSYLGANWLLSPSPVARDPASFLEVLNKESVTILNQTPSAFYNLIQEESRQSKFLGALRYVIFGGEVLNPLKLKTWNKKYPNIRLINMFGITGDHSSCHLQGTRVHIKLKMGGVI